MQVIETKVFAFDELGERAKEKAREWYRSGDDDFSFHAECVTDNAKTIAALMGIEIENIYYSGFCSQGDGACFTGYYSYKKGGLQAVKSHAPQDKELHRIAKELQAIQRDSFYSLSACIKRVGRDSHPFGCRIDVEDSRHYNPSESADDGLQEVLRDYMHWIYRQLETEYEYVNADEQVDESIRINGYTFAEEGERFG